MDNLENKDKDTENTSEEKIEIEEKAEIAEEQTEEVSEDIADDEAEISETDEEESEPITSFEYDVKNEEEEKAFLTFQKKYVYKHNWKVTAAFAAVALLFLVSIIRDPSGYLNWVLMFICLFMIFATWFNTVRIRKYLVSALKSLEDDRYRFTLYDDKFIIETIFTKEETEEEDFVPVKPKVVNFKDISLNVIETGEMFIIILKKETIYVLSKRVIGQKDQDILRERFSELLGEDYEKREDQ
ncbi:hypothetical protein [uncultured Ruminococcus sp.]|uniref:hypothetical protein n=1 Tax=uncultured Ruminococcus sp. TaxID=165186 RepID=UPI0025D6109C|nr:hypothetical protein [uncultured Ruminococcus sp.]